MFTITKTPRNATGTRRFPPHLTIHSSQQLSRPTHGEDGDKYTRTLAFVVGGAGRRRRLSSHPRLFYHRVESGGVEAATCVFDANRRAW